MFRFALVAMAVILVSGCTLFDNLPNADGQRVTGSVLYHDTGIGLQSEVRFGSQKVTTNAAGQFSTRLSNGAYEWTATTLVGNRSGSIFVSGTAVLNVIIQAPPSWNRYDFNQVVIFGPAGASIRWEQGKTVRFWIENNPRVLSSERQMAVDALREWEAILGNTITLQQVGNPSSADLTIRWKERKSIGADGMCTVTWNGSYYITKADINMSYESSSNRGMYRHEVGHCIGLDHHERKSSFVMYPYVGPGNQSITSQERHLAKLLYAARPGLRTLTVASVASEPHTALDGIPPTTVTYNDDGTVTASIYTLMQE